MLLVLIVVVVVVVVFVVVFFFVFVLGGGGVFVFAIKNPILSLLIEISDYRFVQVRYHIL